MPDPEVSVIIPYYNGDAYLSRAIASVVMQTGVRLEIIVVDDGSEVSPDHLLDAFADPRPNLLSLSHAGKGAAVNHGARAARGSWLCILDQDDAMLPGRLQRQLAALRDNAQYTGAYSDYERRNEDGRVLDVYRSRQASPAEMLHALAVARAVFSIQTLILRRDVFESLGGFSSDVRLTGLDDAEFFIRLLCAGHELRYVPGVFGAWYSHPGNYSKGPLFQEARLLFLARIAQLAAEEKALQCEMPFFVWAHRMMRGYFHLEHGEPAQALPEFVRAIRAFPCNLNGYYMYLKSLALQYCKRR
jgi:glycosyltransferase involved in cell wall biosynthesis